MTKLNKIRVSMLAMAMVLMSMVMSVAQTTSPGPATGTQMAKKSAASELKNFKADPANPELSNARLSMLQTKADLEKGISTNTLSENDIKNYTRRIGLLEAQVLNLSSTTTTKQATPTTREKQMQSNARDQIMVELKASNRISRSQFGSLSVADQKFALLNNVTISDLVNASPAMLRNMQEGTLIVPVANFKSSEVEKQIQILNNPSTYLITEEAIAPSVETTVQPEPGVKTHTITRAQLNSMSPDKQKAIEASGEFVITE